MRPPSALVLTTLFALSLPAGSALARPAHKQALADYLGPFATKSIIDCRTCHVPDKPGSAPAVPGDMEERPHNPFGARLKEVRGELKKAGKPVDIADRLDAIANEDSDGDGVSNLIELLTGHVPGDPNDKPTPAQITEATKKLPAFQQFRRSYPWRPFRTVERPAVPAVKNAAWVRNPIDAFLAAAHAERGLKPRPEAPRHVLLRRLYIDLIGLPPTREELNAFLNDTSADAYEKVVDQLLGSPRYGERWGRHWMDVWRYSDVDGTGNQIFSQPHIWRWRDWIIESLNQDKSYDRMILEMLAADELAAGDPQALRATGFLVRNFNQFYPQVFLQDTVDYTSQALLGLTLRCARCHDHPYDPVSQRDYYQVTAIFQPFQVRTDHVPGELNTTKDGLVRVYDANLKAETFLFVRGDLQRPEKDPVPPGIPASLGGELGEVQPVPLPATAYAPERRAFVVQQTVAASDGAIGQARRVQAQSAAALALSYLAAAQPVPLASPRVVQLTADNLVLADLEVSLAEARHAALLAVIRAEDLEEAGNKDSDDGKQAATQAATAQRRQAVLEARKSLLVAQAALRVVAANAREAAAKRVADAEKALAKAEMDEQAAPTITYTKRPNKVYPRESTGRRLAFARWIASRSNPLTARLAVNHIWLRHFGQSFLARPFDLGRSGKPPTHPALIDWLAAEFMERGWSMKAIHKLMVTSSAYRMAATPDPDNAAVDPDNAYYWRMPSRRLEAEVVRDSLFAVAGKLDLTMGGPDIDHNQGLTVPRRSVYFRHAEDRQMLFLKIFDGASAIECYQRTESTVPQQALALMNSDLTRAHSKLIAQELSMQVGTDPAVFTRAAFERLLCRPPTAEELATCSEFLSPKAGTPRALENLVHGLLNHYEFRTLR